MNAFLDRSIRDSDGAILAQWVADGLGRVGPVGRCPMTGVLIVYTSGARGTFYSRGGTNTLTITNVGATVPTVISEPVQGATPDEFVAIHLRQYLNAERSAAKLFMQVRGLSS